MCLEAKARRVGWSQIITDTRLKKIGPKNILQAFSPIEPNGRSRQAVTFTGGTFM